LAAIDKKVTLDSLKKLYIQVEEDGEGWLIIEVE